MPAGITSVQTWDSLAWEVLHETQHDTQHSLTLGVQEDVLASVNFEVVLTLLSCQLVFLQQLVQQAL